MSGEEKDGTCKIKFFIHNISDSLRVCTLQESFLCCYFKERKNKKFHSSDSFQFQVFVFLFSFKLTTLGEHPFELAALHHPKGPKGGRLRTFKLTSGKRVCGVLFSGDVPRKYFGTGSDSREGLTASADCVVQFKLFRASLLEREQCRRVVGSDDNLLAVFQSVCKRLRCSCDSIGLIRRDLRAINWCGPSSSCCVNCGSSS